MAVLYWTAAQTDEVLSRPMEAADAEGVVTDAMVGVVAKTTLKGRPVSMVVPGAVDAKVLAKGPVKTEAELLSETREPGRRVTDETVAEGMVSVKGPVKTDVAVTEMLSELGVMEVATGADCVKGPVKTEDTEILAELRAIEVATGADTVEGPVKMDAAETEVLAELRAIDVATGADCVKGPVKTEDTEVLTELSWTELRAIEVAAGSVALNGPVNTDDTDVLADGRAELGRTLTAELTAVLVNGPVKTDDSKGTDDTSGVSLARTELNAVLEATELAGRELFVKRNELLGSSELVDWTSVETAFTTTGAVTASVDDVGAASLE